MCGFYGNAANGNNRRYRHCRANSHIGRSHFTPTSIRRLTL